MRAAPNFVQGQAVDGYWKQELLIYLGKQFNLNILIETGTCDGGTLNGIYKSFDICYSIELSDYYFKRSKERFEGVKNIHLYHGNSAIELRKLLNGVYLTMRPVLFWLDAHSSGGKTANEGDPLPEEIRAIVELSPDSLVVIDDEPNDNRIKELVNDEWQTEYRTGIVFLYKKGNYNIPEFV